MQREGAGGCRKGPGSLETALAEGPAVPDLGRCSRQGRAGTPVSTRARSRTATRVASRALQSVREEHEHGPCTDGVRLSPGKEGPLTPATPRVDPEDMGGELQKGGSSMAFRVRGRSPVIVHEVVPSVLPPLSSYSSRLPTQTPCPGSPTRSFAPLGTARPMSTSPRAGLKAVRSLGGLCASPLHTPGHPRTLSVC